MFRRMSTTTPLSFERKTSVFGRDTRTLMTWACLAVVYTIWGSTYLALAWVVEGLPPFLSAGTRFALAGSGLVLIGRLRGEAAPSAREALQAAPIGVLFFVVGNGFVASAERHVTSSVAAIACGAMPLLVVLLGVGFGERPRRRELVGVALGLAGLLVMFGSELHGDSTSLVLLALAPLGWALGSQLTRRQKGRGGFVGAGLPMVFGGLGALVVGTSMGESVAWSTLGWRPVAAFFYLVFIGSMVAFTAFSWLLKNTRPSVATSYAYVNPAVAALLGVALGGETLSLASVVGGGLIASGVYLVITMNDRGTTSGANATSSK